VAARGQGRADRTVTAKEALRSWKEVTDKALREPVVITSHGRPRHVLLAYEDFQRLSARDRRAYHIENLPDDLADALRAGLEDLRVPEGTPDGDDTIIC
jgi:prevent-host-death family protein